MDIEASDNFRRIYEKLTTSGIVSPDGLKALCKQAYAVVINLPSDTSEHAIPNERDTMELQEIEYIHIPVDLIQPTASDFFEFPEALARISRMVRVHSGCPRGTWPPMLSSSRMPQRILAKEFERYG